MDNAAHESIVSAINEARFLEQIKTFFSSSMIFLAECMQNSRRAGADAVFIDYDTAESSLVISDNGCGIQDFRDLVTIAASGWTQETMDNEQPFGIGFFSVCFAAASVRVESHGKQIEFSSEDLIAKKPIRVVQGSYIGGARVTLLGCSYDEEKIRTALMGYAKGFGVPVFWKGEELPRPHAQDGMTGSQTSVGFVHVPGVHGGGANSGHACYVYCQGLPVQAGAITRRYGPTAHAVIHVDHLRYRPRMPDRDSLIDAETASEDFLKAIRLIWRDELMAKKAAMSAVDFVQGYWSTAVAFHCLDLMSDVPALPTTLLYRIVETPVQLREGESYTSMLTTPVTQAEVISGAVALYAEFIEGHRGDDFLRLMWAEAQKAVFLSGSLPPGHWAIPHLRRLEDGEVKVSGRVIARADFIGGWVDAEVKLLDRLTVTYAGISHPLNSAVAVGRGVWDYDPTFLVPMGAPEPGYVLRQASTYVDHQEYYCNTDYDLDSERLRDLVAVLAGEPGEETLEKSLIRSGAGGKTNLRGKQFSVEFDTEGNISVTAV